MTVLAPPEEKVDKKVDLSTFFGWKVIVLNDNYNTFEHVAQSLSEVIPDVSYKQGMKFATIVHIEGTAVVFSGLKEKAEHYYAQLKMKGLTMAPVEKD